MSDFEAMKEVVERVEKNIKSGFQQNQKDKAKFNAELAKTKSFVKFQEDLQKKMKVEVKKPKAAAKKSRALRPTQDSSYSSGSARSRSISLSSDSRKAASKKKSKTCLSDSDSSEVHVKAVDLKKSKP